MRELRQIVLLNLICETEQVKNLQRGLLIGQKKIEKKGKTESSSTISNGLWMIA